MQVESGRLRVVAPDAPDGDVPEKTGGDGDLPSPGRYLREQRQRRGLTLEELAVATKIPRSSIELLEEDRYSDLPGTVFVKGFLRCCARELGLGPEAVMELLYERERVQRNARRKDKPPTGSLPQADPVVKRDPPRIRKTNPPPKNPLRRLFGSMPSATVFLWIVVAVFMAMVVLAAFNLMGSAGPSTQI